MPEPTSPTQPAKLTLTDSDKANLTVVRRNFQTFSDMVSKVQYPDVNQLVIDFRCCQDFQLGAILSMISTQVEYAYVLSKLPEYQERIDDRVARFFPALKFTDQQIMSRLHNTNHITKVVAWSPMYLFFYAWNQIAAKIFDCRSMNGDRERPLKVYLLFPELNVSREYAAKWQLWLVDTLQMAVDLSIKRGPLKDLPADIFTESQFMVLYDMKSFLAREDITSVIFAPESTRPTQTIYAMANVDLAIVDPDDKDIDIAIARTEKALNMFCDFTIIPRLIDMGETPDGRKS